MGIQISFFLKIKASKMKASNSIFKTFFLSLCIIANTHFAYGQTASILPPAKTVFLDQNGKPLTSGTVDFYIPSTSTRKTTWQDAAETIPNSNPVVLDAAGRGLILGSGTYRQVVKDRLGNLIWDQVTSSTGSGGGTSPTATGDGDLVGTIKPWAGMTAPNQYMFTYGQEVSRTTYAALFTAITSSQSTFCTSGSPTLSGLSDTTNFWIGMPVEISCVVAGFSTIISKTSTSVTLAANSNITVNTTSVFFPWGRGNETTTFNIPDFRGFAIAGNNNMGGVANSVLTTTYFGATNPNSSGAAGGSQSNSTTLLLANLPPITSTNASQAISVFPGGLSTNNALIAGSSASFVAASGNYTGGSQKPVEYPASGIVSTNQFSANNSISVTSTGTTSTPIVSSIVQPTKTSNYIIKVIPDANSATANGVTDIQGMTGSVACGSGLLCTGNIISVNLPTTGITVGSTTISGGTTSTPLINVGGVFSNATRSGNTTLYMTGSGSYTTSNCIKSDINGNLIDAGAPCGSGSGSSGTANVQDFIAANGDFIAGTTTTLTTSLVPINSASSYITFDGIVQSHDTYSLAGSTFTFLSAIPANTKVVEIAWNTNSVSGNTNVVYATDYLGTKTCDGITDVFTELQTFLTAVSTNGVNNRSVVGIFPPGVCYLDSASTLTFTVNTSNNTVAYRLIGSGTTLKPAITRATYALYIARGTFSTYEDERTNVNIEYLTIDQHNNANALGGFLIERANTRLYHNAVNAGDDNGVANNASYIGAYFRNPVAHNTDPNYGVFWSELGWNIFKGRNTNMPTAVDLNGTANSMFIHNNQFLTVNTAIFVEPMCAANTSNCASISNGVVITQNDFESFTYGIRFFNATSLGFSQAVGWQIYGNRAETGTLFLNLSGLGLATPIPTVLGPNMIQSSVTTIYQQGATPTALNVVGAYTQTFANLASCAAAAGAQEGVSMAVSDSNTTTWGATITGGGANHVLAYCNGTNWTVAGK